MDHPPPDDAERAARQAFLESYRRDLDADAVRGLADYQRELPGHEAAIEAEYRSLEPEEAATAAPRPRQIGPYRLVRQLGRGAQATVHLAERDFPRRQVALKVFDLSSLSISANARARFRREAQATAGLEHPGICSVYETGEDDGAIWIAMQFVDGDSLASLLAASRHGSAGHPPLEWPTTHGGAVAPSSTTGGSTRAASLQHLLHYFEHAARALHTAHEAGLVHRDVKPGNLMVRSDGSPVVLDFGLAHDRSADLGLTHSHDVLGTPYYMAPEQLRGGSVLDARADVWALGVTLYECLARNRPFEAASRDALYRQILEHEAPALPGSSRTLPHDVRVIVATALQKDPDHRYQSALALAEDLRRARSLEPILARRTRPIERLWRWARRHPALASSMALTVVALTAGLLVSGAALRDAEHSLQSEIAARSAWYDDISREVASTGLLGRDSLLHTRMHEMAYELIAQDVPDLMARMEQIEPSGSHATFIRTAPLRAAVLDAVAERLTPTSRICAADLYFGWGRDLLFMFPGDDLDDAAVHVAERGLAVLEALDATDPRIVRSRVLALDAWLQSGAFETAAERATAWLEELSQDEPRITALYRSRLLHGLAATGRIADAAALLPAVDVVTSQHSDTWLAHGALVAGLRCCELADRADLRDRATELRAELAASLCRNTQLQGFKSGRTHIEAALGATRRPIWTWMERAATDRGLSVDELLRGAEGLREDFALTAPDPGLHLMGYALLLAAMERLGSSNAYNRAPIPLLESALTLLRSCDRPSPNTVAAASAALGHALTRTADLAHARAVLEAGLRAAGDDASAKAMVGGVLGYCLGEQGEFERGERLLRGSFEHTIRERGRLSGDVHRLLYYLSDFHLAQGRIDAALAASRRRVESFAATARGQAADLYLHADFQMRALRLDDAAATLARGAAIAGATGWREAELALLRGEHRLALALVDVAARAGQTHPRGQLVRAQSLLRLGRAQEALDCFETAAMGFTFDGSWSDHGLAMAAVGRLDAAHALLERFSGELAPGLPVAHWEHARFLLELPVDQRTAQDLQNAVRHAERGVELTRSRRAPLLAMLCEARLATGELAAARRTATRLEEVMDGRDAERLHWARAQALIARCRDSR